jgi:hypothetical protein
MRLVHTRHTRPHMHALPRSNHREHAPSTSPNTHSHTRMHRLAAITVSMRLQQAQTHTPTHECIASQQTPCAYTSCKAKLILHTHAFPRSHHKWACALCIRTHRSSTRMHRLAAITVSIRLVHKNTQTSTRMHRMAVITVGIQSKHTLQHTHASPRSNHPEHAPCTDPNTHSDKCINCLAASTVTIRLEQAQTQIPTHACIASQQSP